jgi:RHS repeat-associated protein
VDVTSPDDQGVITAPVDIVGTVTDDRPGVTYTISVAPADGSAPAKQIASGGEVIAGVLGQFDPTMLANGSYNLIVTAVDDGGNVTTVTREVEVEGNLKLGRFTLSFTDLTIPLGGIPITITRDYDTLQANQDSDFGYGWRLGYGDPKLKVDLVDGAEVGWGGYPAFLDGTRVYVTFPGGDRQGFTFMPYETAYDPFGLITYWHPQFLPDAGNTYTLSVPDVLLDKDPDSGEYSTITEGGDLATYNPRNPDFGNQYTLTDPQGLKSTVNATTGKLLTVSNRRGNELTFSDSGISSNRGAQVTFDRDTHGRITRITDPAGNSLLYSYDALGNLIGFTDRAGDSTSFTYRTDLPHYVDHVVDPLGRQAARTEYDAQGRVKKLFDAAGKETDYTYNGNTRVQQITDQLGNTIVVTQDSNGNAIREDHPDGVIILRTFDGNNNLLTETRVVGQIDTPANGETNDQTTTYHYNNQGASTAAIDPLGNQTSATYNDFNERLSLSDPMGNTTSYGYDAQGGVVTVQEFTGNLATYTNNDQGDVTALQNENGVTLETNTETSYGELDSMTPISGRQTYYDYDLDGNRIATWYFNGTGASQVQVLDRTYFDAEGRATGTARIVLPAGHFVTSNIAQATFAPQYIQWTTAKTYNLLGQVATETDQFQRVTQHTYDLRGLEIQTRRQSADDQGNTVWVITRTVYDAAGRAVLTTDPYAEGTTDPIYGTVNVYDDAGRQTATERHKGVVVNLVGTGAQMQTVTASTGTLVTATSVTLDNAGRILTSTDSNNLVTTTTYNNTGEPIQTRAQSVDANGQTAWLLKRTVYDELGRSVFVTDPYVEGSSDPVYATRTVYDDLGRVERTVRFKGAQVDLVNGDSVVTSDGTQLSQTQSVYDAKGRLARSIDANGQATDYEYDNLDRRTAVIGPTVVVAGQSVRDRTETVYDSLGRVAATRTNIRQLPNGTIDASQVRVTQYGYDAFNNLTTTTFPDQTTITATFDAFGRKNSETDQFGQTKTFEYNADGQLTAVTLPPVVDPRTGQSVSARTEYGYDAFGHQTLVRDALGHETRLSYDAQGNELSRTLPLGFGPDGIKGTADDDTLPEGNFTEQFQYDDRGRQTLQVSFAGAVTHLTYDTQTGQLSQSRLFPSLAAYNNGAGTPSEVWTFTYDAFGRQVAVVQTVGSVVSTTTSSFDGEQRVTQIASPQGTINYEYDNLGRHTRTYSGSAANPGNDTSYGYDNLGRLATVTVRERDHQVLGTPEVTTYQYDLVGNLAAEQKANGILVTYAYDALNRLTDLTQYAPGADPNNLANSAKLAEFAYTLRGDGLRSDAAETFWLNGQARTNQIHWTYDGQDRLIDERLSSYDAQVSQTEHFTFDLVGNRLTETTDLGNDGTIDQTMTSGYDANDRLLSAALQGPGGVPVKTTTYGYTGTLQTSEQVVANGVATGDTAMAYNLRDQLVTVTVSAYDSGGDLMRREQTNYGYDALGNRASTLYQLDANGSGVYGAGTLTTYQNDPMNATGESQVLQETTSDVATSAVQKTVVYTIGLSVTAQTTTAYANGQPGTPTTFTFGADGHGSTRELFDATGATATVGGVLQVFHYDAYGNLLKLSLAQAGTSLLYAGQLFDVHTGLQFLRARWYDPTTGRFTKLDPYFGNLQDPRSLHKYLYTGADPVNLQDPSGMAWDVGDYAAAAHILFSLWVFVRGHIPTIDFPLFTVALAAGVDQSDPPLYAAILASPARFLKPDAVNFNPKLWFELKPISAKDYTGMHRAGVQAQLDSYIAGLGPLGFTPGNQFVLVPGIMPIGIVPGENGTPMILMLQAALFSDFGTNGLIYYYVRKPPQNSPTPQPVPVPNNYTLRPDLLEKVQEQEVQIYDEVSQDIVRLQFEATDAFYTRLYWGLGVGGGVVALAAIAVRIWGLQACLSFLTGGITVPGERIGV